MTSSIRNGSYLEPLNAHVRILLRNIMAAAAVKKIYKVCYYNFQRMKVHLQRLTLMLFVIGKEHSKIKVLTILIDNTHHHALNDQAGQVRLLTHLFPSCHPDLGVQISQVGHLDQGIP
jgi:hypothetical protein